MKLIDSIFRLSLSVRGFGLPIMVCDHNGPFRKRLLGGVLA